MVRKALVPAAVALALVVMVGFLVGGPGAAASAGIGIAIVYVNFATHGISAWASTVSVGTVMGVALGGFAIRLAIIVGAMFALNTLSWFSPAAFGLAVVVDLAAPRLRGAARVARRGRFAADPGG